MTRWFRSTDLTGFHEKIDRLWSLLHMLQCDSVNQLLKRYIERMVYQTRSRTRCQPDSLTACTVIAGDGVCCKTPCDQKFFTYSKDSLRICSQHLEAMDDLRRKRKGSETGLEIVRLYDTGPLSDPQIAKILAYLIENTASSSGSPNTPDPSRQSRKKRRAAEDTLRDPAAAAADQTTGQVSKTMEKLREAETRVSKLQRDLATVRCVSIDVFSKSQADIVMALRKEKKNVSDLSAKLAKEQSLTEQHRVEKLQAEELISQLRDKIVELQAQNGTQPATPRLATPEETKAYRAHILNDCLEGDDVGKKIAAAMDEFYNLVLRD